MAYDAKSKERTMKYLEKLKEVRFRVKPEEYARYEQAAKQGNYKSLRQFYLSAINEKVATILGESAENPSKNEKKEEKTRNSEKTVENT